jgi:hypothetical protein
MQKNSLVTRYTAVEGMARLCIEVPRSMDSAPACACVKGNITQNTQAEVSAPVVKVLYRAWQWCCNGIQRSGDAGKL